MSKAVASAAFAALVLAAAPALAAEACTKEPKSAWMTQDAAKAKAVALGYTPSKVKEEDACWEVYAKDAKGDRWELFLNPVSGELVRKKAN
ncbi:PepSY domain-containing protein [Prosthecomicrobium sp. N25]|uniref:PepSY domain-containing protein n=1 Tax=Prosthecomicrobium sp. N25 TaxID=3129254 RepID=UPI003077F80E